MATPTWRSSTSGCARSSTRAADSPKRVEWSTKSLEQPRKGVKKMATILAYTSPALGHLLPISALLSELSRRGHTVHVRTLSSGVEIGQGLGFTADAIDPRIEGILQDDWKATNPI